MNRRRSVLSRPDSQVLEVILSLFRRIVAQLGDRERLTLFALIFARLSIHVLDIFALVFLLWIAAGASSSLAAPIDLPINWNPAAIDGSGDGLIWPATVVVFFFILKSGLGAWLIRITTVFLARIDQRQSRRIADYFFEGEMGRLDRKSDADRNWIILTSTQQAFGMYLFSWLSLISESGLFLAVVLLLFIVNPSTAVLLSIYFALVSMLFYFAISRRVNRLGERFQENSVRGYEVLGALSSSYRQTRLAGVTTNLVDRLFVYRSRQANDWGLQRFLMGVPRYVIEIALMLGLLAFLVVEVAVAESLALIDFGVFVLAGLRLMAALLPIQHAVAELRIFGPQARTALDAISELRLDEDDSRRVQNPNDSVNMSASTPPSEPIEVVVEDLSFWREGENFKLGPVNLTIKAGSFHVLCGQSGSGKSTLADFIAGLAGPETGHVSLHGERAQDFVIRHPGTVSYVPQKAGLVPGTFLENITFSWDGSFNPESLDYALSVAGLLEFADNLPSGLDTPIAKNLDSLSGGQLQRLSLARALYSRPRLLIVDEPTSALDPQASVQLTLGLKSLSSEMTVVVISHDIEIMSQADRLDFLAAGRHLASGTFATLRVENKNFRVFTETP